MMATPWSGFVRGFRLASFLLVLGSAVHAEDLDRDGLEDSIEQLLAEKFRPKLVVSARDCDAIPAEFARGEAHPIVVRRNGTIYFQAFPVRLDEQATDAIEIHYYHLWRKDCGRAGHDLDTEHVSVLLRGPEWKAAAWYAAAHEATICDLGQAAVAVTLGAVDQGPVIWVSHGKHASFLSQESCRKGCGGDRCQDPMRLLPSGPLLNLGEPGTPLNGSLWTASNRWALQTKMRSEFPPSVRERLEQEGPGRLVYFNSGLIPVRATVMGLNSGVDGLATGVQSTESALDQAERSTSEALRKAGRATRRWLGLK